MLQYARRLRLTAICAALGLVVLNGCASTGNPADPLESFNRGVYNFNETVDGVLLKPAAEIYEGLTPSLVRTGVSNAFANINDVTVALNNLLQGKFSEGISDLGRVVINTTAGLLGIFDVATPVGLEKHNEDFGQTLGYWGVGDGPYLVLPIFGPSNPRDTVGLVGDYFTNPVSYIDSDEVRYSLTGLRVVSKRAELLGASNVLETAALDKYEFVRDAYLQRRRNLIHDGNPPREKNSASDAAPSRHALAARNNVRQLSQETSSEPSILWSGTPPTPAEEELIRRSRLEPSPTQSLDAVAAPAAPQSVARVWLTTQQ